MSQVGAMERGFVSRTFSQIGSLYYKDDVELALQERPLYAEAQEYIRMTMAPQDSGLARMLIGIYDEAQEPILIVVHVSSLFLMPFVCFIVLRARLSIICASDYRYSTKMAKEIRSCTICQ
jgi:hypothetical protein